MLLCKEYNTIQKDIGFDSRPAVGRPNEVSSLKILVLFYILIGSPGSWYRLNSPDIYSGVTLLQFHFSECSSVLSGKCRNGTFKEVMAPFFQMLDYSTSSFDAVESFHNIAFWVIASCSLVCAFVGNCCFHFLSQSTMKIEVL